MARNFSGLVKFADRYFEKTAARDWEGMPGLDTGRRLNRKRARPRRSWSAIRDEWANRLSSLGHDIADTAHDSWENLNRIGVRMAGHGQRVLTAGGLVNPLNWMAGPQQMGEVYDDVKQRWHDISEWERSHYRPYRDDSLEHGMNKALVETAAATPFAELGGAAAYTAATSLPMQAYLTSGKSLVGSGIPYARGIRYGLKYAPWLGLIGSNSLRASPVAKYVPGPIKENLINLTAFNPNSALAAMAGAVDWEHVPEYTARAGAYIGSRFPETIMALLENWYNNDDVNTTPTIMGNRSGFFGAAMEAARRAKAGAVESVRRIPGDIREKVTDFTIPAVSNAYFEVSQHLPPEQRAAYESAWPTVEKLYREGAANPENLFETGRKVVQNKYDEYLTPEEQKVVGSLTRNAISAVPVIRDNYDDVKRMFGTNSVDRLSLSKNVYDRSSPIVDTVHDIGEASTLAKNRLEGGVN